MQLNSSVNTRYYPPYHYQANLKKGAGILKMEGDKHASKEAAVNQRSAKTVDYQQLYQARRSHGAERIRGHEDSNSNVTANAMGRTGAVSIAETEDKGEFLGFTMVPEEGQSVTYGMRAMLSDKSAPDNPIVQVVSNLGGKKVIYNVEVNKVDPNNATQLEMFALLNYTDKMGTTDGGAFGSHQQLKSYGGNASSIGYCGSLSGEGAFLNERFDWAFLMEKMVQVYRDAGINKQAEDCQALLDFFGTYRPKNKSAADDTEATMDYAKFFEERIKEIFEKIQSGDTEPTYQIGAQSFTEKEWEEFLDKFDSIEEAIQELMKEEQARKEAEEAKKESIVINDASTLLTAESTSCVYETSDQVDDGVRYITWYTEEGIFCRKAGQKPTEGYEWSIAFENKEQYDKVMEFIGQFPSGQNMRFAAREDFWNDFLNDELDMEGFKTDKGMTLKGGQGETGIEKQR